MRLIGGALALVLNACVGTIERDEPGPGAPPPSSSGDPGPGAPPASGGEGCRANGADSTLRRLSRDEHRATVAAFLPGLELPTPTLPQDRRLAGYLTQPDPVADDALGAYLEAAEAIGRAVASDPAAALAPCRVSEQSEATCVDELIARAGRWAMRREIPAAERARLAARFWKSLRDAGEPLGVALGHLTTRLLVSPRFLYHLEPASNRADGTIDGPAIAARLSYFLVGAPPDDALFALGRSGALADPATRAREAMRLYSDPRAAARMAAFVRQWLHLERVETVDKDASVVRDWGDPFRASMLGEAERFIEARVREGAPVRALFESRSSFVDARLAPLYGLPAGGAEFRGAELPGDRPGLLGQAAFLAGHAGSVESSVIHRGLAVRKQLLCLDVPPPDASIVADAKVDRLVTQPCASCHALIDPIGQAFEGFDAVGRARTHVDGAPVSVTGELRGTGEIDGMVEGPQALVARVLDSDLARRCLARQWARFALAREVDDERDACTIGTLAEAVGRGGSGRLADLVNALVRSPAFVRGEASNQEGTCP